jgi:predicted dehydrogenase
MEALAARPLPGEPLKIGAVGLGYWGPNLARNLDDLEGAALIWICDREEDRLARYAGRFPDARTTTRFEELLEDDSLDAVAIATPVVTHFELVRQALLAGKHVFVEKPLALSSTLGEQLVALAEERGLVLMPGHLLLYHPGVAKLKDLVDSEELGRLLYVYGNRQNLGQIRKDENALWSLGAHDLSRPGPAGSPSSTRASRTSSSAISAFRRGSSPICTCPGSIPTRCAG